MSAMRRAIHSLCLVLSGAGLALQAPALADSVPFWGASASVPIDRPFIQLKKVEFLWMGEAVSTGTACAFDGFVAALLALPMGGEDFDEIARSPCSSHTVLLSDAGLADASSIALRRHRLGPPR